MVLDAPREPVKLRRLPRPQPAANELLVKIAACAVCRTDLHVVDGELPDPKRPIIPGHEIVGRVAALGSNVENFALGERVESLGWAGPAGSAGTAATATKIYAPPRALRDTRLTGVMPNLLPRMRATVSVSLRLTAMSKLRLYCAPD